MAAGVKVLNIMSVLDESELKSAVWQKVSAYLRDREAVVTKELRQDLDSEKTAKARGRLSEISRFLAIDEPSAVGLGSSVHRVQGSSLRRNYGRR